MALRSDIHKILIIGAGPIIIGQACEFDYSGSQACRALMAEGYEVVLVNSNPATIMTDPNLATQTYIEPLTVEIVKAIIEKERPDAILPTMGGQTALNIAFQLHDMGVLEEFGVELIGANFEAIQIAEDREAFKEMVLKVGLGMLRSFTVHTWEEAKAAALKLGFPLIIRAGFTLGGSGGSVVYTQEELEAAVLHGLDLSPINQLLLEESALGWKEYEFEVMRDAKDNVVIVCSVENIDPMGVHTGDSITVAPAQTLSDKEYQALRNASIQIIRAVGVDAGGCNIQFAIHPKTGRIVVIEMNPRVSRSSALVSKATGVPIAKISAQLAIGKTLDEIPNDITRTTPASFEPTIDYVVTKIPRFSFEKFPGAQTLLSPQMKSVGEVMAIGRTFQESFQKALCSLETGLDGFHFPRIQITRDELLAKLRRTSSDRLRWIYQALHDKIPVRDIYEATGIDPWFLENFRGLVNAEEKLVQFTPETLPTGFLQELKEKGFSDAHIGTLLNCPPSILETQRQKAHLQPVFKSVDTCAGEFEAYTPYFYSTYEFAKSGEPSENEAHCESDPTKRVLILGSGPNRIGQGIEFDYCCVHAAFTLKKLGYEAIMINCNPETVSTDYDISDRLYFEPLTPESVMNIIHQELGGAPKNFTGGIIVQLGGQTPLKLARALEKYNIPVLGTSIQSIDMAEDRDRFREIIHHLNIESPASGIARTEDEAFQVAQLIGYPLIIRPSYILGGQSMRILYSDESLKDYLSSVIRVESDYPVLIDRFLERAIEVDVDAICDGKETYVAAILEHIEHAGIHSGDSTCVWPAQTLSAEMLQQIEDATIKLAEALQVKGLMNLQFAIKDNTLYLLEANPRASRTVPFVCKASGLPLIQMAVRVMMGESLKAVLASLPPMQKYDHVAVKAPVFPFIKFKDTDPKLGPEMRSTGEVMGIDRN
ncbi:MAG: carbamoyl-phosphate synthase large subunit, partial [Cyanobacteria bacterium]|nr:carbamoyl-phosphate synthase large subunit [Cyanobacteriota bacterium]